MSKTSELTHLFRSLKAPAAARATPELAERAREESWSHERFLEAVLSSEVASRDSHGGESRIKAARFPSRKMLEEFDFTFQRSAKKQVVEHLGQLDFLHGRENVVMLSPPGIGKTHLAIALGDPRLPRRPASRVRDRDRDRMGRASAMPSARATSRPNSLASLASRCSSSTRSATSPSTPRPRT